VFFNLNIKLYDESYTTHVKIIISHHFSIDKLCLKM
ncbi:uncharacterized protein METZ01_LOCUS506400, partial [marine metagenome]